MDKVEIRTDVLVQLLEQSQDQQLLIADLHAVSVNVGRYMGQLKTAQTQLTALQAKVDAVWNKTTGKDFERMSAYSYCLGEVSRELQKLLRAVQWAPTENDERGTMKRWTREEQEELLRLLNELDADTSVKTKGDLVCSWIQQWARFSEGYLDFDVDKKAARDRQLAVWCERYHCSRKELQDCLHDLLMGRSYHEWAKDFRQALYDGEDAKDEAAKPKLKIERKKPPLIPPRSGGRPSHKKKFTNSKLKITKKKIMPVKMKTTTKKSHHKQATPGEKSKIQNPKSKTKTAKIPLKAERAKLRAAKKAVRKPNAAFMAPVQADDLLGAIVGLKPLPRTEITKRLWNYIKQHGLQDQTNRRQINCDEQLALVLGKPVVTMFEMTKQVSKHFTKANAETLKR